MARLTEFHRQESCTRFVSIIQGSVEVKISQKEPILIILYIMRTKPDDKFSSFSSTPIVDDHKCLMAKKSKQMAKRVEDQVDIIKSLTQKLETFKLSHSILVNKYDILLNKVACATNLSTCVTSLEQEKQVLNDKLEKLTSEHMDLQACH
jgi:hypothetical protein